MKRCIDLLTAVLLILLLWPFIVVAAALVRVLLGSPVVFRQQRPGHMGVPFTLCKFRSMSDARDNEGRLLPDDVRVTRFGRLLRASSLDELPQLWNVLKGDMSLVGPRPLLMHYLPRYSARQSRRHEVRPGITGWAQVNGRNSVSWEERLEMDVWYVENRSWWLDMKIIGLTIRKVFSGKDVNAEGAVGMPEFTGGDDTQ